MTILNETAHAGEFILSLANGDRSLSEEVLAASNDLVAGTVVGKITTGGQVTEWTAGAADGSEDAYGVLLADAVTGVGETAKVAVVVRDAEVIQNRLTYEPSGTPTQMQIDAARAQLVAAGIIVRDGV